MAIPSGVILIWDSTNATIPSGWERVTALDGKYPKAWSASVTPNQSGGANTHTHTGGGHSHTLTAHTHAVSLDYINDSAVTIDENASGLDIGAHSHTSANIGGTTGGALQSTTVTWSSVNQEPPYHTVIFIKPSSTVGVIQSGICVHYNGATAPTGWNYCNGTSSTSDLRNKYLKGATTGGNAGTTGGATTHQHTITHGHTATVHSHSGTSGSASLTYRRANGNSANYDASTTHTHAITLSSTTDVISNYTNTTAGSTDTVEPAYKKLGVIQNAGGSLKVGIVGLWLGTTASIPNNWNLCDGDNDTLDLRDKFIKIGSTLANNNDTGGANTHTHSNVSHTHTASGTHTHTGSSGAPSVSMSRNGNGNNGTTSNSHTHPLTVTAQTSTYSSTNITADTVSNQPTYLTVAYIQLNKINHGGNLLLNFM